ncbi:MAG: hypothetical protein UX75_C0012G0015 [Candidatus Moranbacteria bacterium GW2011_GWE2_47_10]|nr:MAG: hypothetical protein UX75_C0012G0015 [Candidatus Moranbacteria bacterium GW2011_GWE2_47_10]
MNSVYNRAEQAEKQAFPETEKTFEDRIKLSQEKAGEIIDNANMVEIAKDIMRNHPEIDIQNPDEQTVEKFSDPYDPAVIVGIMREIDKRIREKSN